jgi:dolichyl-phosphate beta-glucosyltransferase
MLNSLLAAAGVDNISSSISNSENNSNSNALLLLTAVITTTLTIGLTYFIFHPAISQRQQQQNEAKDNVIEEDLQLEKEQQEKQQHYSLSLIIPAYNEEERLPPMLLSTINHLKSSRDEIVKLCDSINTDNTTSDKNNNNKSSTPFEIVIVNDGSKDDTVSAVKNVIDKIKSNKGDNEKSNTNDNLGGISIRLITLKQNSGKGAAVRTGMLQSKGNLRLMVDADDATNFQPSLLQLLIKMNEMKQNDKNDPSNKDDNALIAFGSRAHLQNDSKAKRSFVRTILMISFHFFVQSLCSNSIHDTQCGFKLFTKDAAQVLFHNLHLTRWAFDTELVVIAEQLHIPIIEVGVEWEEVDGSKLATSKWNLLKCSVEMLRDMLCVRVMYTLGLWRLKAT